MQPSGFFPDSRLFKGLHFFIGDLWAGVVNGQKFKRAMIILTITSVTPFLFFVFLFDTVEPTTPDLSLLTDKRTHSVSLSLTE